MKLAVLFFGMSKAEYDNYWYGARYVIDYEKSYENYQQYIFDFFKSKGYDIDVYFTTNALNDDDKNEIIKKYNPVKCNFIQNHPHHIIGRNSKIINVVDLCLESGNMYDLVLITRFDLLFQKDFNQSNIQFDKFNMVSILEKPNLICDNFYLFPYKYLKPFSEIAKNNFTSRFHDIKDELYAKINKDENSVNYILNENCCISDLSFYKIVRVLS
jgi:hypothetical protein